MMISHRQRHWCFYLTLFTAAFFLRTELLRGDDFFDPNSDPDALPQVPDGFEITVYAREPLVRQPCSMAFDARGRLYVGMGPQYRTPKPNTPGDSVVVVLDEDQDGVADTTKQFATGFNAIQGLAWHGRDLWVANAPDLTIVRDLDGDDVADEYIKLYTDLGNLEHGLHGLVWAPDGKLYMSKGNSKGHSSQGRWAPKPFRDLWGVTAPPGTPDFPPPQTFSASSYQKSYHDPKDDWGLDGGILRCDDLGENLEIISRGFRNPWDIAHSPTFDWLGTDNDQTQGDRVFMSIPGGHFGWNHAWSPEWTVDEHPPTAPVSGPLFEGSGTGIVYANSPQFPDEYRNVFLINDWLRKATYTWKPKWDGALMRPDGDMTPFVLGNSALFRPTDMEFGPDGALWILGWSRGYGAEIKNGEFVSEGRIFRVRYTGKPLLEDHAPRDRPLSEWPVHELVAEFDSQLPVRRIDAQDELVRRGTVIRDELIQLLKTASLSQGAETWLIWTLGRMSPQDTSGNVFFEKIVEDPQSSENLQLQSIRILTDRLRRSGTEFALPNSIVRQLRSTKPRIRAATITAISEGNQVHLISELVNILASESDRVVFYMGWKALRGLASTEELLESLKDSRGQVRKGALLALLETHDLQVEQVQRLLQDQDPGVRQVAALWIETAGEGIPAPNIRGAALSTSPSPHQVPLIGEIRVESGANYVAVSGGLKNGAQIFIDRKFTLKQIPEELAGLDYVQTSNDDDGSTGERFITFHAFLPVRIYVAIDSRMKQVPRWITSTFTPSHLKIRADHWDYLLFSREFPPGPVELGGNTDDGRAGGKSNYLILIEALPLQNRGPQTTINDVLAILPQGDAKRGEILFKHSRGAGCAKCHSLDQTVNGFGPHLGDIGQRAAVRHIVESIVNPSAVITEGFQLQVISTEDGHIYSGVLIKESGLSLTLGLSSGEVIKISKKKIDERKSSSVSSMPEMSSILSSQQVADITTFLMQQKGAGQKGIKKSPTSTRVNAKMTVCESDVDRTTGLRFEEQPGRLVIKSGTTVIGEFVRGDDQIRRPFFANIQTSDGIKLTRTYPPRPDFDLKDHADMHPGVWLAFGNINGTDFWRNRGTIEHVRFSTPPALIDKDIHFTTLDRLLNESNIEIGTIETHFIVSSRHHGWRLVCQATVSPGQEDIVFGDQEEMGFGCRLATELIEKRGATVINSQGQLSCKQIWGKTAQWCDSSAEVGGQVHGVTVMASSKNFRPSWWHTRDYGLMVANPFGQAALAKGKPSQVRIKPGESMQLTFGAVFHSGFDYDPASEYTEFESLVQKLK